MSSLLDYDKSIIENGIKKDLVSYSKETDKIIEIMNYSSFGGKYLRGIITLETAKMFGETLEHALPYALALEYIQSYSLIHDDLPCMDNDEMRRGKPSCHIKYGYSNALLGGDSLLTHAFETISHSDHAKLYPDRALQAVSDLSEYAGYKGMISGQILDLQLKDQTEVDSKTLHIIHSLKTVCLFKAAILVGCDIANAEPKAVDYCFYLMENFGYAFQIIDDIIDSDYSEETAEFSSYVKVNGLAKSITDLQLYISKAKSYISNLSNLNYDVSAYYDIIDLLISSINWEM